MTLKTYITSLSLIFSISSLARAQSLSPSAPSKEYIRQGGQVVAIENARQADVVLSPSSLAFGSQNVGTTSAGQTITLTNNGDIALTISSVTISGTNAGDFSVANGCGSSVAVGAACSLTVTFKPTATGTRGASLTIADSATGSPQTAGLSGTGLAGVPTAALAPTSLSFAVQTVSTASVSQAVTLTNGGTAPLAISSVTLSGTNPGDFTISANSCGSSVAAGANCTISVRSSRRRRGYGRRVCW